MSAKERAEKFMAAWATRRPTKDTLHRKLRLPSDVYDLMLDELTEQFNLAHLEGNLS